MSRTKLSVAEWMTRATQAAGRYRDVEWPGCTIDLRVRNQGRYRPAEVAIVVLVSSSRLPIVCLRRHGPKAVHALAAMVQRVMVLETERLDHLARLVSALDRTMTADAPCIGEKDGAR